MEELIRKKEDGTFDYDFEKYFSFDEALLAEWKLNSSEEYDLNVLSELMERLWDKTSICTDGKGRLKEQRWIRFVETKVQQLKDLEKPCICQQLTEKVRAIISEGKDVEHKLFEERVCFDDGGHGPSISLFASIDPRTKKRVYFSISATEEGESFTDDLKFCPFCGRPLNNLTIDDFK